MFYIKRDLRTFLLCDGCENMYVNMKVPMWKYKFILKIP